MSAAPENLSQKAALTFGQWGEGVAEQWLNARGFRTIARNYRIRGGEIDLICADSRFLLLVEVKTRSGRRCGEGAEAVTPRKQRRIIAAAQHYYYNHPTDLQPRFDVVEVYATRSRRVLSVRHFPGAFEVRE